jgi:hypothetical protein
MEHGTGLMHITAKLIIFPRLFLQEEHVIQSIFVMILTRQTFGETGRDGLTDERWMFDYCKQGYWC